MIRLEYFEDGCDFCPLIVIYGHESFCALIEAFKALSIGQLDCVVVEELPSYESVNGCHLTLYVGNTDKGIRRIAESIAEFSWVMTRSSWDDLAALAEPFMGVSGYAYQWLAGREVRMANLAMSNIALVISTYPDGQW